MAPELSSRSLSNAVIDRTRPDFVSLLLKSILNPSMIAVMTQHLPIIFKVSVLFLSLGLSFPASSSTEYQTLMAVYKKNRPMMSNGDFREPLTIDSSFSDDLATGEIHALINNDFASVSSRLISTQQWCDMLVLHINVKGCYAGSEETEAKKTELVRNAILLYVGRNFYQPVEDAYLMEYKLEVTKRTDDYLKTTLIADKGPFGTSEYLLEFEAIPVSEKTTFIHFKYSYQYGFLARVALQGYLATLGRKKVGFSIDKYDANSQPVYVKGVQGIVERNSMRYFIAIRAFLNTFTLNNEGWGNRIEHWYQLALPYKRQLLEVKDRKYIDTKQQEFEKRVSLETALAITDQ